MRRMKDMEKLGGGGMMGLGNMPETYNLVVNANHPLVSEVLEDKKEDSQQAKVKQMYDLALLAQSMLKGKDLSDFIKRSFSLIK